jgi:hypothetical protein
MAILSLFSVTLKLKFQPLPLRSNIHRIYQCGITRKAAPRLKERLREAGRLAYWTNVASRCIVTFGRRLVRNARSNNVVQKSHRMEL